MFWCFYLSESSNVMHLFCVFPRLDMDALQVFPDAADQRVGRAGRTGLALT